MSWWIGRWVGKNSLEQLVLELWFQEEKFVVWLLFHRYGKVEQRLTARRGRTSGRNHMTINLVSLEGEDEVRAGDENSQRVGQARRSLWKKYSEICVWLKGIQSGSSPSINNSYINQLLILFQILNVSRLLQVTLKEIFSAPCPECNEKNTPTSCY